MSKKLWIVMGIVLVLFVGAVWVSKSKSADVIKDSGVRSSHIIGKSNAKVALVEYSDFQCSACRAYYPIVEQIIQKYKDRISFEYRHYPLTAIHRNAFAAAGASEAASKQNKFWEMYHELFDNQSAWENAASAQMVFEGYAERLGLDKAKFRQDFTSKETSNMIYSSIAEFNQRGLPKATPTFLLNGQKIEPRTADDFSRLIDERLRR